MDINIFSRKMRSLRKVSELTQDAVASKLGVTVQAVSKWECGSSFPDVGIVADIAELYGVSTDYLLCDDTEECEQKKTNNFVINNSKKYIVELCGKKIISKTLIKTGEMVELTLPNKNNLSVEVWSDAVVIGNKQ